MQLDDTRGEILRLVAMLRTRQQPESTRPATVPPESVRPARSPSRRARPPVSPPRTAPDGSERLQQRRHELTELRELRQRLEQRRDESHGTASAVERLEHRIIALEEVIYRLHHGSRQASYRPASSHPPNRRSGRPSVPGQLPDAAIQERQDSMFSGRIQGQMLSDMLQLVSSNGLTGVFVVENQDGETRLFFEEGKMFHAVGGELAGEQAFFAAFSAETGHYYFRELEQLPDERSISASTQLLILEALRQIDESLKARSSAPPNSSSFTG